MTHIISIFVYRSSTNYSQFGIQNSEFEMRTQTVCIFGLTMEFI